MGRLTNVMPIEKHVEIGNMVKSVNASVLEIFVEVAKHHPLKSETFRCIKTIREKVLRLKSLLEEDAFNASIHLYYRSPDHRACDCVACKSVKVPN